ncbi:sugar phosphate isomerase/epimerase [Rhodospirillales bacterium]|nr:sugar phosphate isomerase/epimerase [Rhodospirillales bacterium]
MKLAASNIALPAYEHGKELEQLRQIGLEGIEIAPSRVWRDTWGGLSGADVELYKREIESAGLKAVGLHSLFFDQPDLGIFCNDKFQQKTLKFMVYLSEVCRDLGGKTLIYGGGRQRGQIPEKDAYHRAIDFCGTLCDRIKAHGTCYCFEPLGANKTDFINTIEDSLRIVRAVNSKSLRVQLDAEALAYNNEISEQNFLIAQPYLVHVHANEPGFQILGSTGQVDHAAIGRYLRAINYDGFVSIEQKMIGINNPIKALTKSVAVLSECYV